MGQLAPYLVVFQFILLFSCAAFFYKAADLENQSGIIWAALSMGLYLLTWLVFGWGILANVIGQVGLLIGIGVFRAVRQARKPP